MMNTQWFKRLIAIGILASFVAVADFAGLIELDAGALQSFWGQRINSVQAKLADLQQPENQSETHSNKTVERDNTQAFSTRTDIKPLLTEANSISESTEAFNRERKLTELAEKVTSEREKIQSWHAEKLNELIVWKNKYLQELEGAEKIAWAKYNQQLKENTVTTKQTNVNANTYGYTNGYMTQNGYYSGNTWGNTSGYVTEDTYTQVYGNPAGYYEQASRNINTERGKIEQRFKKLNDLRDRKLSELNYYELEARNRIHANFRLAQRQKAGELRLAQRRNAGELPLGNIISISISSSGQEKSIFVGGSFFSEGDTIGDFKIVRILEDGVEYEKAGKIQWQSLN